jgi:thioredoxin 1
MARSCVSALRKWERFYRAAGLQFGGMSVSLKDFYADWCGPCKTQDPILDEVEEDYPEVSFEKVNVDEQQDVANEYQVRSLPTLIIENDDGVVERFVGVTQRDDIESALQKAGA